MTLYTNIVLKFAEHYRTFISDSDEIDFREHLHTLKGLSGTIGAERLYRLTQMLESSNDDTIKTEFKEELSYVCNEIDLYFNTHPLCPTVSKKSSTAEEIIRLVDALKGAVASKRPKRIWPLLSELESIDLGDENSTIDKIKEAVDTYDFDEAKKLIERIELFS